MKDTFSRVSLCHPHWLMPPRDQRVSGQKLQVGGYPQERGFAAGTTSRTHLPAPASVPVLHRAPSRLPSSLASFSPLNRLRQQDGTNLWLNSPKITRDLSKAVCVKLTGACTLLSNALSSEASPAPLLATTHQFPASALALPLPTSPAPTDLAIDPTWGVLEEVSTAPCLSTWQRSQEGPGLPVHHHPYQSCSQSGSSVCQPVLLQSVHAASWPSGERVKRSMETRPRAWQRWHCHWHRVPWALMMPLALRHSLPHEAY